MTERAKKKIAYIFVAVAAMLAIGTWTFHKIEGWSWIDAFYFSASTLTTVGFGDLTPTTDFSKLFTVAFMFIGIAIVVYSLPLMGEYYIERRVKMQQHLEQSNFGKMIQAQKNHIRHSMEESNDDANSLPGPNHARLGRTNR